MGWGGSCCLSWASCLPAEGLSPMGSLPGSHSRGPLGKPVHLSTCLSQARRLQWGLGGAVALLTSGRFCGME